MDTEYTLNERTVAEGNVVLFKRERSRIWQARIRRYASKWIDMTTKERDFDKAKKVATEKYYGMKYAQDNGLVDISKSFKKVAEATVKQLQNERFNENGREIYTDYERAIRKYFIPFFGNTAIHNIDRAKLHEFDAYRTEQFGRTPTHSTIATHNSALNKVFDVAIEYGYLLESKKPKLFNKGRKAEPRTYFDVNEYRKISSNIRFFWKRAHKQITKDIRYVLWNYVLILANTGMRCGRESLNIKWRDLNYNDEGDITITVSGKTGKRTLVAQNVFENTATPLKRLRDLDNELKGLEFADLFKIDEYVFRMANGKVPDSKVLSKSFSKFLKQHDLYEDNFGNSRSLYCLRHTYATQQLVKHKTDLHTLARQMGTSRKMLDEYYSDVEAVMNIKQLSGREEYERRQKTLTENEQLLQAKLEIAELKNELLKLQNDQAATE
jgi:integrase